MQIIQKDTKKIIYPELSYTVVGVLFSVHKDIGNYAKEKQYSDLIELKLIESGIDYKRELIIGNSSNIIDFLIDNKIILEIKAKRIITREDYYQLQRYLQETQNKLGLLVNFRNKFIKPIRVIRIDTANKSKFVREDIIEYDFKNLNC